MTSVQSSYSSNRISIGIGEPSSTQTRVALLRGKQCCSSLSLTKFLFLFLAIYNYYSNLPIHPSIHSIWTITSIFIPFNHSSIHSYFKNICVLLLEFSWWESAVCYFWFCTSTWWRYDILEMCFGVYCKFQQYCTNIILIMKDRAVCNLHYDTEK